jgi:hypothetical protein
MDDMETKGKISEAAGFFKQIPAKHRAWLCLLLAGMLLGGYMWHDYFGNIDKIAAANDGSIEEFRKESDTYRAEMRESQAQLTQNVATILDTYQSLQKNIETMTRLSCIAIIFNKDVPANKRAEAFDIAKKLGINHDIKNQYRSFILQYPDAAWQDKSPSPPTPEGGEGRWVQTPSGVAGWEYDN